MTGQVSPSTGRRYPRAWICQVWRVPRASVYAATRPAPDRPLGKRGPRTPVSDAELVTAIRAILAACPFYGEGYRKVRARLAHRGLPVGGQRVLRLMRQHRLLAPRRLGHRTGIRPTPGRSSPTAPTSCGGRMRPGSTPPRTAGAGSSAPSITGPTSSSAGMRPTIGDRWAALEPLRQGVRHAFGGFGKEIARGLTLRCDWGPQDHRRCRDRRSAGGGMTISPSYVGEPECNGVIERFMRTLKEQCCTCISSPVWRRRAG